MENREQSRKIGEALVVYSHPDVCKAPVAPVPFPIVAKFDTSFNVATTVNATKVPTFTEISRIQGVQGDEGGTGKGVKSGTHAGGGVCEPTKWSSTVRAEGQQVVRHEDPFLMNSGNTDGEVVYQKGGGPVAKADDKGEPPADPKTRGWLEPSGPGFYKGAYDNVADTLSGYRDAASTAWDATGLTSTPEAAAAARGRIGDAVSGVRDAVGDAVYSPFDPAARARTGDRISGAWDGFKQGYSDAYAEGGLGQAIGHGAGQLGTLAVEALGAKGAGKVIGTAAKRLPDGDKTPDPKKKKPDEEGDDGTRVKRDEEAEKKKKEEEAEAAKKKKTDEFLESMKKEDFKPEDNPALWSGNGPDAARAAGNSTLENTVGGRAIEDFMRANPDVAGDWSQAGRIWDQGSAHYANGIADVYGTGGRLAGTPVDAYVSGARPGSVFNRVEGPILRDRGVNLRVH
jgi:hypothetical protein